MKKEYSIVVINFDNSEDRIDTIFESLEEAQTYTKKIDRDYCSGYRIMEMEYHFENEEKIYDDEIVVDSIDFEED